MYRRGEIDHWTDEELVELWRERSAMRTESQAQADYLAGQEVRQWITRPLPQEIREAMRAKFTNTRQ